MKLHAAVQTWLTNPVSTQDTRIVIKYWFKLGACYRDEDECPSGMPGEFYNVVAERRFLRGILGIEKNPLKLTKRVLEAHPFGENGPSLAALLNSNVKAAMSLVPLTPPDSRGTPVLVRLYCVSGLNATFDFPFAEHGIDFEEEGFAWFIAGLPKERGIPEGRSWQLAANLLAYAVKCNDISIKSNLAQHYIVTGSVAGDKIEAVKMGRKCELAGYVEYKNLNWIIPMDNKNEEAVANIPPYRKMSVTTLTEAYELIKSMQSRATSSMLRFVKNLDPEGVEEQIKNGADVYAIDSKTGFSALQLLRNTLGDKTSNRDRDKFLQIKNMLLIEGADCALSFYLLARGGNDGGISDFVSRYPINARNMAGLTAADFALMARDWNAIELLLKYGAKCDSQAEFNPALKDILSRVRHNTGEDDLVLLQKAFKLGLSFSVPVEIEVESSPYYNVAIKLEVVDSYLWQIPLAHMAVYKCNYELLKLCLENGFDPNQELEFEYEDKDGTFADVEARIVPKMKKVYIGYPVEYFRKNEEIAKEKKTRLIKLVETYGAVAHT